jgi:LysM repeat protein
MEILKFIKNAGSKLIGTDDESKSKKLTEEIKNSGLDVENLNVVIKDDKASVYGVAAKKSIREKILLLVGNRDGIESVEDHMSVKEAPVVATNIQSEPKEPEAQFYTVVKGDTLGAIAKKFYGNAAKYPEIFEANKPMLKNPDLIYPGQCLRIPKL